VPSKKKGVDYDIRWFTPELEINLCGHATLASAYVVFEILKEKKKKVVFDSKSGHLTVLKDLKSSNGFRGLMDFPSWKPEKIDDYSNDVISSLGNPEIVAVYKHRDTLVELTDEETVKKIQP